MNSVKLSLRSVSHQYAAKRDSRATFSDLSFSLETGSIACLLGPSGCGKTTALRAIAGFEQICAGEIVLNGQVVSRPGSMLPAQKRQIGMVFQDFALFPHLTVAQNIDFGLFQMDKAERRKRVEEMLEVVGLNGFGPAFPHQLSGGQQQRVALARALAPSPQLLLLDEPFSSLDVDLRERLGQEVRAILKQQNTTAILVTHDQHEAFAIADEIGILFEGRLQQWSSAYHLYHEPVNRYVASFIGEGVLLPATVCADNEVELALGRLPGELPAACTPGSAVDVLIRPDDVLHDDASPTTAVVLDKAFRGAQFLYTLGLADGTRVLSLVPSHHNHRQGEKIGIRLEVDHLIAFAKD